MQACPPSAAYRLRKFVRRHKGPVLAGLLILLALVAGVVGTTYGLIRAEQQRLVVENQRNELAERNQALQAAREHERLLNERARQAIETVTSEASIDLLMREKELRPEQKDFLDKMIQYYAEASQDGGTTEQERTRQARAYYRMGRMNQILGRSRDSDNAYRRAVSLLQQLADEFPTKTEYPDELALHPQCPWDAALPRLRAAEGGRVGLPRGPGHPEEARGRSPRPAGVPAGLGRDLQQPGQPALPRHRTVEGSRGGPRPRPWRFVSSLSSHSPAGPISAAPWR